MIWLIAIVASFAVHGLLFSWRLPVPAASVKEKIRLTRINFRQEKPSKPQPVIVPLPSPPKPVAATPKPVPRQRPKRVVTPKPEPIVQSKAVAPSWQEKDSAAPSELTGVAAKQSVGPPIPASAAPQDEGERQQFLRHLFSHIETHKYYPVQARRRRLEGEVLVSFTLLGDGGIRDLRVEEGQSLLREAAGKSIRESLPLPVPKAGAVTLPLQVSFRMAFRLR